MTRPSVVWFRDDLRLADNPAWQAAADRGSPVVAVYLLDEQSVGVRPLGGAARWWLHYSLESLGERLDRVGVPLILRRGSAGREIRDVVAAVGADAVFWNRRYGGPERAVDTELKSSLTDAGVQVRSFAGSLLFEPWTVRKNDGGHYSVFTPFWKACTQLPTPRLPYPEPHNVRGSRRAADSDELDSWRLRPTPDWASGLRETWSPGEGNALTRLAEFAEDTASDYGELRDNPAAMSTSLLSPRLRWGEISPFQAWHAVVGTEGSRTFQTELGWREFAWHTAFYTPNIVANNLRREFDQFPWSDADGDAVRAWQRGATGFGMVDAGMRELWHTGHMHNRARMVTASFLVKNLLVHWRVGEQWFWDTLVDADSASNPFNWQWVAGSGVDAAPYFRIFNPELQAKKFDPQSRYISRWVGDAHETPIVDLAASRQEALDAYRTIRRGAAELS